MRIHLDIEDGIRPVNALNCVKKVVEMGRISDNGKMYCYATVLSTNEGDVCVITRRYRKSDCFKIIKYKP